MMWSRVLGALLVTAAACGGSPATRSGPQRTDDTSDAVVFGAEAWRMPGSVDFIEFVGDDMVAVSQSGAVARFTRAGARTMVVERLPEEAYDVAMYRGGVVLAGSAAKVVDLATGAVRAFEGGAATRIAIAGDRGVIGGDATLLASVGLASQTPRVELEQSRHFEEPAIAGSYAVAIRRQQTIGVWDLATGKRHRVFALGNSSLFALSPDQQWLVAGTFAGKPNWAVDIYRLENGRTMGTVGFSCNPGAAAISPDSKLLAIACDEELRVVKLPGGERVTSIPGTGAHVREITWSPTGDLLAVGGNDNILHAWRTGTWEPLGRVEGSRGVVRELAVAGRYLVTHSWGDSSAWLWVTDLVKPVIELGGKGREVMAIATDGNEILVALTLVGKDRRAAIERWRGAARVANVVLPQGPFGMSPLIREIGAVDGGGVWFTASGRVTTLDETLATTWISPTPSDSDTLDGHASATRDGSVVVLRTHGEVTVIDAIERTVLLRAPHTACLASRPAVSPDGLRAAVIEPSGISIIETATGKVVASVAFPSSDGGERALAWRTSTEIVGLAEGRVVAWTIGATSAITGRAPNAVSLAVTDDRVYLGRTDGTVVRRSYAALLTAGAMPVTPMKPCDPEDGMMGGFGFGGSFGEEKRGRLDDNGSYDEPDTRHDNSLE